MNVAEVQTPEQRVTRGRAWDAHDRDEEGRAEEQRTADTDFVKMYGKGFRRLRSLIDENPKAAKLYAFLAEHIDPSCGAVVASRAFLATEMGVSEKTITRHSAFLEESGAVVRIKIGTGVWAYCLDPEEVWRSFRDRKRSAAFLTRTLVNKHDRDAIVRRLKIMMDATHGA